MAKWINFNVVGGVTTGQGGTAAPQMDGDNLLLASSIVNVSVVETAAGAPDDGAVKATLNLSTGIAKHVARKDPSRFAFNLCASQVFRTP